MARVDTRGTLAATNNSSTCEHVSIVLGKAWKNVNSSFNNTRVHVRLTDRAELHVSCVQSPRVRTLREKD